MSYDDHVTLHPANDDYVALHSATHSHSMMACDSTPSHLIFYDGHVTLHPANDDHVTLAHSHTQSFYMSLVPSLSTLTWEVWLNKILHLHAEECPLHGKGLQSLQRIFEGDRNIFCLN